ncbi:hypothetical protein HJC23_012021, partial [Cyclotella cryptica]
MTTHMLSKRPYKNNHHYSTDITIIKSTDWSFVNHPLLLHANKATSSCTNSKYTNTSSQQQQQQQLLLLRLLQRE